MKFRHIIFLFLPAVLLAVFFLFIRIKQYQPLLPEINKGETEAAKLEQIPIFSDDPIIGDRKAGKTILTFADLGCEHCREELAVFFELIKKYPKQVKIVWKGLPVTRFPRSSEQAHTYAYCANQEQAFVPFVEQLLAAETLDTATLTAAAENAGLNSERWQACLISGKPTVYQKKVESLATGLNISTVPTVFVNGEMIQEPETVEGWTELLGLK